MANVKMLKDTRVTVVGGKTEDVKEGDIVDLPPRGIPAMVEQGYCEAVDEEAKAVTAKETKAKDAAPENKAAKSDFVPKPEKDEKEDKKKDKK